MTTWHQLAAIHRQTSSTVVHDIVESFKSAWLEIQWRGSALDVLVLSWFEGYREHMHSWILASNKEQAQESLKEVCTWNAQVRGEVLSSMMHWINSPKQGNMEQVMLEQESVLREQMVSAMSKDAKVPDEHAQQNTELATLRSCLKRRRAGS